VISTCFDSQGIIIIKEQNQINTA